MASVLKPLDRAAFEHKKRQYFIRCAEHAIRLAPLPEFRHALWALKSYDENPSATRRNMLKRVYRALRGGDRSYGYNATGEFYWGLIQAIAVTLYRRTWLLMSSDTQHSAEAYYCATVAMGGPREISSAHDKQQKIWDELFPPKKQREAA